MSFEPHWLWLIAAAVLAGAELLIPGVFLIFLAAAALLTGVVAGAFGIPVAFQLAAFALFAIGSLQAGRRYYARREVPSADPHLNDRIHRYIGETVTVVTAIENGSGRVKLGDGVWTARGPDAPVGAHVRILGAEGTALRVTPVTELPSPE
ncbi:NfeD family protein [Allosphingosinicella indica]|uniref:NfeD-like C-terminal domain-containing protein n=1 Tax=Allosphingosinicella indica TaxID=941907 RepID=A0A1X7H396_9SPHN|nr:NfeD family protein [Allosphingosinicella indica]SMF79035.1 hypothetical protein SAMN06295910_2795 [Allosphingosinicella indica]